MMTVSCLRLKSCNDVLTTLNSEVKQANLKMMRALFHTEPRLGDDELPDLNDYVKEEVPEEMAYLKPHTGKQLGQGAKETDGHHESLHMLGQQSLSHCRSN